MTLTGDSTTIELTTTAARAPPPESATMLEPNTGLLQATPFVGLAPIRFFVR